MEGPSRRIASRIIGTYESRAKYPRDLGINNIQRRKLQMYQGTETIIKRRKERRESTFWDLDYHHPLRPRSPYLWFIVSILVDLVNSYKLHLFWTSIYNFFHQFESDYIDLLWGYCCPHTFSFLIFYIKSLSNILCGF